MRATNKSSQLTAFLLFLIFVSMKKLVLIFLLDFFLGARAQKVQTIVPSQPVVVGNAFQIQYIISDPSALTSISTPAFDSLHIVSGPNHYKETAMMEGRSVPIENITYTLVPSRIGK